MTDDRDHGTDAARDHHDSAETLVVGETDSRIDLAGLRKKFGVDIRVRSRITAVDAVLREAQEDPFSDTDEASIAHYDKVFDRTNPGYNRDYDRG